MADRSVPQSPWLGPIERLGRAGGDVAVLIRGGVEEFGHAAVLFVESLYWLLFGRWRKQPVRINAVIAEMMEIGIRSVPIASVLSLVIGVTLAMQGIDLLRLFGAEEQVVVAVALSVVREFAPLITGILLSGRSGSALAARLGTMTISQEIDALKVMGINPVRFLVVPALVAMVVMLPLLTFLADFMALLGAALYTNVELGLSLDAYADRTLRALSVKHVMHGIGKSLIFGVLIALIGCINGFAVSGGAEGVGRATTRAVVVSIAAIIVTDMLFIFVLTR